MQTINRIRSNRREHDRVRLQPMYTSVIVEPKARVHSSLLGHAYDVSQSGVRIELDEPLAVGESVIVHVGLPGGNCEIRAEADVMWVNDEHDDPGPRRMALRFTEFESLSDERRLSKFLATAPRSAAA